jgi:hypothetical protein
LATLANLPEDIHMYLDSCANAGDSLLGKFSHPPPYPPPFGVAPTSSTLHHQSDTDRQAVKLAFYLHKKNFMF